MKRIGTTISALLIACLMLLTACADSGTVGIAETTPGAPSQAETTPAASDTTPEPQETTAAPVIDNTPVTVLDTYMPADVSAQIKSLFEGKKATFSCYSTGSAPYAIRDVYGVSNGVLKSITIPVHSTGAMDADGNFIFTVKVFDNSIDGLKSAAKRDYKIKIKGADYSLEANKGAVYKFIKIDLSEYEIVLTADETLAFYSATDTIHPAYLKEDIRNKNQALNLLKTDFYRMTGFLSKLGTADVGRSISTLVYDFEFERTYENQAAYDALLAEETEYQNKIAELKKLYEGKKLSVIGDSISTYTAISNSAKYNKTISSNAVWYPTNNTNFYDHTYTYWGRLMEDLGMELCVNNSWSGSRIYGKSDVSYVDNMLGRATELDNDNGTATDPSDDIAPDVILIYIGINDLHGGSPRDIKLFRSLSEAGENTDAIIEEWLKEAEAKADSVNGIVAGKSYTCWEAAYALGIKAMKEKYPDAEIICMTLVRSQDDRDTAAAPFDHYNTFIKAIAGYFGAILVDQEQGYLLQDNCHAYGSDLKALHPNQQGHALMEKHIIETLYEAKK